MVTPASLYILRSFLKASIETLVRQAFTLACCSCCAACCSAVISPRPRRPPPPPPPRAPPGAGITHSVPFHDPFLAPGGSSAGIAPRSPRPPAPPAPPPPAPRPPPPSGPATVGIPA